MLFIADSDEDLINLESVRQIVLAKEGDEDTDAADVTARLSATEAVVLFSGNYKEARAFLHALKEKLRSTTSRFIEIEVPTDG